jgi:hypothetical protein
VERLGLSSLRSHGRGHRFKPCTTHHDSPSESTTYATPRWCFRFWWAKSKGTHWMSVCPGCARAMPATPGSSEMSRKSPTTAGKKVSVRTMVVGWAHAVVGDSIEGFQLKRIRSGVETLLAATGVSREVRGRLQYARPHRSTGSTLRQARLHAGEAGNPRSSPARAPAPRLRQACSAIRSADPPRPVNPSGFSVNSDATCCKVSGLHCST